MTCFVPGCAAVTSGQCKTWGAGCEAHLARWSASAARVISRLALDPENPGRAAHARASFMRLLRDEETRDKERRLAREVARAAENQAVPV